MGPRAQWLVSNPPELRLLPRMYTSTWTTVGADGAQPLLVQLGRSWGSHWQCYNVLPGEAIQGVQAAKHALPPQHGAALNFYIVTLHHQPWARRSADIMWSTAPWHQSPRRFHTSIKLLGLPCLRRENGWRGRVPAQCNGWALHVIASVAPSQGWLRHRQREHQPYGG